MNSKSVLITFPTEKDAELFAKISGESSANHQRPASGAMTGIVLDRIAQSESVKRTSDDCLVQCIVTKYHGPANTRGSRISARCASGKVIIPLDHSVRIEEAHRQAAEALREKMGWKGKIQGGALPDGTGYAFVFVTFE